MIILIIPKQLGYSIPSAPSTVSGGKQKKQDQPHVQSEKVFGAMNGKSIFAYIF